MKDELVTLEIISSFFVACDIGASKIPKKLIKGDTLGHDLFFFFFLFQKSKDEHPHFFVKQKNS